MKKILNYLLAATAVLLFVCGIILVYLVIADLQYNEEAPVHYDSDYTDAHAPFENKTWLVANSLWQKP
ncbi:hypothetical protein [Thalassobacillus pellis]|uniref:hypothetical protein n=1 Tax=Thalassobacillus pellis TaxID=748008 RepID=UPI001960470E|nr:hypothetical protein [Thalassobacillus pellis]MBM7553784.1 succinate dehydrogenase hydrophobic anchor subunit [Thalassobacillus pellis]